MEFVESYLIGSSLFFHNVISLLSVEAKHLAPTCDGRSSPRDSAWPAPIFTVH